MKKQPKIKKSKLKNLISKLNEEFNFDIDLYEPDETETIANDTIDINAVFFNDTDIFKKFYKLTQTQKQ